ncbi:MAG: S41 family peptidase [Bacteroidota bacterium]
MKYYLLAAIWTFPLFAWSQETPLLNTYSLIAAEEDFDLLVSSLKEAHAGLYWYNSIAQFESLVAVERAKLYEGMDSYAFFRIAAKIVAATREGHCGIGSSRDVGQYFNQKSKILPIVVKVLDGKVYLLNDLEGASTRGKVLTSINGDPIEDVLCTLFSYSAKYADGYIETGKIRFTIDYSGLAYHYADFYENRESNILELVDSETKEQSSLRVSSVSAADYRMLDDAVERPGFNEPIALHLETSTKTATLAIHSFRHTYYDAEGDESLAFAVFKQKIDSAFALIKASKIQNLILDIRNNTGGTEGYEDYVLSYLVDAPYTKYRYVQANALSYSFLEHTQYNTPEGQREFEESMREEFALQEDGRFLRKADFMLVAPPKGEPYLGKMFVLISGKTYSGGSEFAALLKGNTEAVFVGEETAGGFYGQTSGFSLILTLPHTGTRIKIPLLKFVVNVEDDKIPMGRGVIPDYPVEPTFEQFTNRIDAAMAYTQALIQREDE